VAGRVRVPLGNLRWCPLAVPAITRIYVDALWEMYLAAKSPVSG
jgi:hypothetical protein